MRRSQLLLCAVETIEPPFAGYRRTLRALESYLEMARRDDGERLPAPAKPITPGHWYPGVPRLTRLPDAT